MHSSQIGGVTMAFRFAVLGLCLWLSAAPAARAAGVWLEHTQVDGVARTYALYVPQTANPKGAPLLVLLHGSGGNGAGIAELWKDKADKEGIVLLAPDARHNDAWRLKQDAPGILHALIDEVGAKYMIDGRRIYLFGQSGGAVYSLMLAMLESPYFAAVAVHAGSWRYPEEFKAIGFAQRKIPLAIVIGDQDAHFTIASVRRTEDALKAAGFPVQVTVIAGQHHGFNAGNAPEIENDAWAFLSAHALIGAPAFVIYR